MSETTPGQNLKAELHLPNGEVIKRDNRQEALKDVALGSGGLAVGREAVLLPAGEDAENIMSPESAVLQKRGLDRILNSSRGIDGLTIPEEDCSPQEARRETWDILEAMHAEGGVLEGEESFGSMQFVSPVAREYGKNYSWESWDIDLPSLPKSIRDIPDKFDNEHWLRIVSHGDWPQDIDSNFAEHDNKDHLPTLGTSSGEYRTLVSHAMNELYIHRAARAQEWDSTSEDYKPGEIYAFNPLTEETSAIVTLDQGTADQPKGAINTMMNKIIRSDLEITNTIHGDSVPLRSAEDAAQAERYLAQQALSEDASFEEIFKNKFVGNIAQFAVLLVNSRRVRDGRVQIGEQFTDGSKRREQPTPEEVHEIKELARGAVEGQIRVSQKLGVAIQASRATV